MKPGAGCFEDGSETVQGQLACGIVICVPYVTPAAKVQICVQGDPNVTLSPSTYYVIYMCMWQIYYMMFMHA